MEWDLAVFPEPLRKPHAFSQLLDKIQTMYEEVCARNEKLEVLAVGVYENGHLEGKKDVASLFKDASNSQRLELTFPFVPKERVRTCSEHGPRTPRALSPGLSGAQSLRKHTSMASSASAVSSDLKLSIDNLAKKQEHLNEQIIQMLKLEAERGDKPTNTSEPFDEASKATAIPSHPGHIPKFNDNEAHANGGIGFMEPEFVGDQPCRLSIDSGQSAQSEDSNDQWHTPSLKRGKSRFAVQTGGTKEYAKGTHRWSMVQEIIKNRPSLKTLLEHTTFTLASSVLILSYAVLIAVETSIIAADPESDSLMIKVLHYLYTTIFCGELGLRFAAYGRSVFAGEDGFWNKLDVFFVSSAIVETVMESVVGQMQTAGSVVRAVRIGRIIRTVRLVRTFHQFHEFQKMAYALMCSMKTLFCSMALLLFVMFFFAVWLTQGAADVEKRRTVKDLELRYGNLLATTYTLFLSVSNGISWDLCYMPLYKSSFLSAQAFILYMAVTMFGVLNVVTSIFVEGVMRSMQRSKDLIVQDAEDARKIAVVHMQEVFKQLDSDGSGQISMDELEHFLSDASLRQYMDALDIHAEDTRLLFRLLDCDNSGVISVEEFCDGCYRLKGGAKSIDVNTLIYQNKQFFRRWGEFTGYVDECFAQVRRRLPSAPPTEFKESKDKARMYSSRGSKASNASRPS